MVTVFEKSLVISQTSRHYRFGFTVPRFSYGMRISFSYSPGRMTDREYMLKALREGIRRSRPDNQPIDDSELEAFLPLKNLLTLSVDSPGGVYIGAAHRAYTDHTVILTELKSSRGFIPVRIEAGEWVLTLSSFSAEPKGVAAEIKAELFSEGDITV